MNRCNFEAFRNKFLNLIFSSERTFYLLNAKNRTFPFSWKYFNKRAKFFSYFFIHLKYSDALRIFRHTARIYAGRIIDAAKTTGGENFTRKKFSAVKHYHLEISTKRKFCAVKFKFPTAKLPVAELPVTVENIVILLIRILSLIIQRPNPNKYVGGSLSLKIARILYLSQHTFS